MKKLLVLLTLTLGLSTAAFASENYTKYNETCDEVPSKKEVKRVECTICAANPANHGDMSGEG